MTLSPVVPGGTEEEALHALRGAPASGLGAHSTAASGAPAAGGNPGFPSTAASDALAADGLFEVLLPNWTSDDVRGQPHGVAPTAEAAGGRGPGGAGAAGLQPPQVLELS